MLDVVTLIIVTLTAIMAFVRGFIKELFGVVGIILSFILTYYNYDFFTLIIGVKSQLVANIISTFLMYIIVIVSIAIVNSGIMYILRPIRLGFTDRFLGIGVGILKGLFFSFLLFLFLKLVYYTLSTDPEKKEVDKILPNWMIISKMYKPFVYIEENINQIVPEYVYENIEKFGKELSDAFSEASKVEGPKDEKNKAKNQ